ncbi:MAG: glycosyltransferase [Ignavibacteriaceae bacterium]
MKNIPNKNILFISDSSVSNPVLHSQGLPLLKYMSEHDYNCTLLSYEYYNQTQEKKELNNSIKEKYIPFISFEEVQLKKYEFVPFWVNYFFSGFFLAKRLIKKNKIKIVHARSLYPALICFFLKFMNPGLKILYDNRGVFVAEQVYLGQWSHNGITETVFRKLEKQVIKKSDHIVVVSKIFKYFLENEYPSYKNLSNKISVINNKTSLHEDITIEEIVKRKNKNTTTCIFSGSSAKWQNIEEIFSFTQSCISKLDDFRFQILTYETEIFSKKLQAYSNLSTVTDILNLNSSQVFDQLSKANFGLLLRENNLVNNVSSPIKFGEYLAAGLPAVVSEGVGDTGEIINKYKVGVVLKNNDYESAILQLKELLKEPDIYRRCRYTAQKEFNLKDSFEAYKIIYNNLLNSNE